ncbi:hypothetical protein ADUPG1_003207, partial [Aduncisulcus paluster]
MEYIPGKKNIVADTLSRIGHRERKLQRGEKVVVLSNDEADAQILEWRPAHVKARSTPLKGKHPEIVVRDSVVHPKPGENLKPKVVMYLGAGEHLGEPGGHNSREKWIEKIRKSQKEHLASSVWTDKPDDFIFEVDDKVLVPEVDKKLVTEIMSAVHDDPLA